MKSIPIILVLAVTGITSCKDAGTSPSPDEVFDQIRVTVFRHQMPTHHPAIEPHKAYFLGILALDSIGHHYVDPSDRVMNAFKVDPFPIRRVSECTISSEGVFDRKTGNLGVLYFVGSIKQIRSDQYEVDGGWYVSGTGAEGYRFTVTGIPYHWMVTNAILTWIS